MRTIPLGISLSFALLLSFGLTVGAPASAGASPGPSKCGSDVVFIGVRGTASAAGSGSSEGGTVYASGGFESQIQPIVDKFVGYPGPTVWARAISYPATGGAGTYPAYGVSVDDGTTKLVTLLNSLTSCPVQPMVILAGHSQGAQVIAHALGGDNPGVPVLSAGARLRIKAVIMYGDPQWRSGKNYLAPGSPTGGQGFPPGRSSYKENSLAAMTTYGWPFQSQDPNPQWFSKIRSWCYAGDWACQNQLPAGQALTIHNSYKDQAQLTYEWATYMIANTN